MDPKLSNLDPKLQDAYHRVMGSAGAGNPQQQQPQQTPQSAPQPSYTPPPPPMAAQPQSPPPAADIQTAAPPTPTPNQELPRPIEASQLNSSGSIPGVNSTMAFNAEDSHRNVGTTPVKKGRLHIMPIVIGLGIMVLLAAYTFVWIMLFNVQVPFLPQL